MDLQKILQLFPTPPPAAIPTSPEKPIVPVSPPSRDITTNNNNHVPVPVVEQKKGTGLTTPPSPVEENQVITDFEFVLI